MSKLKLVHVPSSVLTTPVKEVPVVDQKIRNLVYDMEELLISQIDPQGVGLAAPQVGRDLAIFIIKPSLKSETEVFINPKIIMIEEELKEKKPSTMTDTEEDIEENDKLEGCLSIPHVWGPVRRPSRVQVQYQDLAGEMKTKWFSGFKAIIVQHEMDHLKGILFTRRALEQKTSLYEEKDGDLKKLEY